MNPFAVEEEQARYSVDGAFDWCARLAASHYENFPVASLFLPPEKRPYLQAIYAFSRIADDFADEGADSPELRLAHLAGWDDRLTRCYEGEASHPVFVALRETVRRTNVPRELLADLITAFKRDVTQNRYASFADLLDYCRCSANPVGRLVLTVFGYRDEELFALSDRICTALQLANFWQDVAIDCRKDRLYLPLQDMERFGWTLESWQRLEVNDRFRNLMKFEVARTRELFYSGAELPSLVEPDLRLELKLVWFGGMSILKSIERVKFDVVRRRPHLTMGGKLAVFLRGLMINDLPRWRRKERLWDLP